MEYKIFGTGRSPGDEFRAELRTFCELDDVQREALADWFETTSSFDPYATEFPSVILASPLLPEQFRKSADAIRFLLDAWYRRSLVIDDIERDLLLLGLEPAQIVDVCRFLSRLSQTKERVWRDARESVAKEVGLPTLEDANIVWDARPVFGGSSVYYPPGDECADLYKQCLGLSCMAIVEFMVSDSNGLKQRLAIQMNEDIF